MDDKLTCSGRTDATIVTAIAESLGKSDDFKNPWDTTTQAITNSAHHLNVVQLIEERIGLKHLVELKLHLAHIKRMATIQYANSYCSNF